MSTLLKYRPDIDGLRALAIIPVVLFHVGFSFPGGFIGVDVFFVISGFLITGIILRELEENRFTIRNFYARRVRRIIPALAFMLIGVLGMAWWLYLPFELDQLGKYLTTVSTFLANFTLYTGAGYWSPRSEELPLLHMWSLAVEEQFYIIIPVFLIMVYKWINRWLIYLLIALFILSLAFCVYFTLNDPKFAFYMLPTRSWELLIGSIVYYFVSNHEERLSNLFKTLAGIAGMAMVISSCFILNNGTVFPGYIALLPVLGAALIIVANSHGQSATGVLLSWAPLRFIGLISYPLYLWHWPIIVFYKSYHYPHALEDMDRIIIILLSVMLATISWKWVEFPFRTIKPNISSIRVVATGGAVLVIFLMIALTLRYTDGLPMRFALRFDGEILNLILSDLPDRDGSDRFQAKKYFSRGGLEFYTDSVNVPRVVVIGDSHAAMFAPVIENIAESNQTPISFYTQDGRNPIVDGTTFHNIELSLEKWKPKAVVVSMRWDGILGGMEDEIAKKLTLLSHYASKLYVVLDVPRITDDNVRAAKFLFQKARDNQWEVPLLTYHYGKDTNEKTYKFLKSLNIQNLQILDPVPFFVRGDTLNFHQKGKLYYRDDDHLNLFGAMHTRPLFEQIFVEDRSPS